MAFCIADDIMIKKGGKKRYPNGVFSMTLPLLMMRTNSGMRNNVRILTK